MATTLVVDPRLPIPDSLSTRDPSHPANLARASQEIQNQAAADARYDMQTPKRFRCGNQEGFRNPIHGPPDILLALGLLLFVFFVWLAVRNDTRALYTLVLLLAFALFFLVHKKAFD